MSVGDDAAVVRPRPGMDIVASTDMLVAGTHFLADTDAHALGWKALAVNLSDLAAMAAQPRWVLLAISLPAADERWVEAFAGGFFSCAEAFEVDVIGGDTTRGPLTITPTVFGEVPHGRELTRAGARAEDDVWISGSPGRASLGLAALLGRVRLAPAARGPCLLALHRPQPRVALGLALRDLAHAAIDVSDGLLADLGHIAEQSRVTLAIIDGALPWSAIAELTDDNELARSCLLSGGDDYELAFTAARECRDAVAAVGNDLAIPLARIGAVSRGVAEVRLLDRSGVPLTVERRGYDHFE